jgi:hypothetical protein
MTTDDRARRKTVIAGLDAAIRDIECPVQFSPLLMEARRMLAALPSQAQADGWQIVPKEPTMEMIHAADLATERYGRDPEADALPIEIYSAMLAAAPSIIADHHQPKSGDDNAL